MENQKTEAVTQQKQETVTKQKNALRIEQRKRLVKYNLCKKEELNPIHPGGGGGVFHLQASKLLRTPKRNKL